MSAKPLWTVGLLLASLAAFALLAAARGDAGRRALAPPARTAAPPPRERHTLIRDGETTIRERLERSVDRGRTWEQVSEVVYQRAAPADRAPPAAARTLR